MLNTCQLSDYALINITLQTTDKYFLLSLREPVNRQNNIPLSHQDNDVYFPKSSLSNTKY